MKSAARKSTRRNGKAAPRDALRLDGNAAAGMLSELFVPDLTTARAKCAGCGATQTIGALHVYAHGMGMIVRCPGCDTAMLRLSRTPTHLWLDATGAKSVVVAVAS
jgi:ribosomal protein S27E